MSGVGVHTHATHLRGASAVRDARRFVVAVLAGSPLAGMAEVAELCVSELVTNAVLYGHPPLELLVLMAGDRVRVEVRDANAQLPVALPAQPEAMSGRGLGLVAELAGSVGVTALAAGKSVWFELSDRADQPRPRRGRLPATWTGSEPGARGEGGGVPVVLGSVPTQLLLDAKTHVDNLVRECHLATSGAAGGATRPLPRELAAVLGQVAHRFAAVRIELRRSAASAAARGDDHVHLELLLPVDAADAAENYLRALDEADAYCRSARLLSLESPPQHRELRRWYVEQVARQLRAAADGGCPRLTQTFEQRLLLALDDSEAARNRAEAADRLLDAGAALARARSPEEVAHVVLGWAVYTWGATGAALLLRDEAGGLRVAAATGGTAGRGRDGRQPAGRSRPDPGGGRAGGPGAGPGDPGPVTDRAVRTGVPVWVESPDGADDPAQRTAARERAAAGSRCALPLLDGADVIGVLQLDFRAYRGFATSERAAATSLAALAALALSRVRLQAERSAAGAAAARADGRLHRLLDIAIRLGDEIGGGGVLDLLIAEALALRADRVAVSLLSENGTWLELARLTPEDPILRLSWARHPVVADRPAARSARTGLVVLSPDPASGDRRRADSTLACVPLAAARRILGVLSLRFPDSRTVTDDDRDFLLAVGRLGGSALAASRHRERSQPQPTQPPAAVLSAGADRLAGAAGGWLAGPAGPAPGGQLIAAPRASGIDVQCVWAVHRATRAFLHADHVWQVLTALVDLVRELGATVGTPHGGPAELPLDLSLGRADPLVACAEPASVPRQRLEAVLPEAYEDARRAAMRLERSG
jgi:anti-sigma regulatory factor (Ser/Thr protein kinase)